MQILQIILLVIEISLLITAIVLLAYSCSKYYKIRSNMYSLQNKTKYQIRQVKMMSTSFYTSVLSALAAFLINLYINIMIKNTALGDKENIITCIEVIIVITALIFFSKLHKKILLSIEKNKELYQQEKMKSGDMDEQ